MEDFQNVQYRFISIVHTIVVKNRKYLKINRTIKFKI